MQCELFLHKISYRLVKNVDLESDRPVFKSLLLILNVCVCSWAHYFYVYFVKINFDSSEAPVHFTSKQRMALLLGGLSKQWEVTHVANAQIPWLATYQYVSSTAFFELITVIAVQMPPTKGYFLTLHGELVYRIAVFSAKK